MLTIGSEVREHAAWVAIDASGWCARIATSAGEAVALPPALVPPNILAALAAACLGVGQVFLAFVERAMLAGVDRASLFDLSLGAPGYLDTGPNLPALESTRCLSAAVASPTVSPTQSHGRRCRAARGRRQGVAAAGELGPYVCATRERLGMAKAAVIRDVLAAP